MTDFSDKHSIDCDVGELSALTVYVEMSKITPRWIDHLMRLRNAIVSVVGIKDLGTLSAVQDIDTDNITVGERVGIFTLIANEQDKVMLSDKDKHLDVVVTLEIDRNNHQIALTTAVSVHNLLGRLYLLPVIPAHKVIVPALLNAYANSKRRYHEEMQV